MLTNAYVSRQIVSSHLRHVVNPSQAWTLPSISQQKSLSSVFPPLLCTINLYPFFILACFLERSVISKDVAYSRSKWTEKYNPKSKAEQQPARYNDIASVFASERHCRNGDKNFQQPNYLIPHLDYPKQNSCMRWCWWPHAMRLSEMLVLTSNISNITSNHSAWYSCYYPGCLVDVSALSPASDVSVTKPAASLSMHLIVIPKKESDAGATHAIMQPYSHSFPFSFPLFKTRQLELRTLPSPFPWWFHSYNSATRFLR